MTFLKRGEKMTKHVFCFLVFVIAIQLVMGCSESKTSDSQMTDTQISDSQVSDSQSSEPRTFINEKIVYGSDKAANFSFGQALAVTGNYLAIGASDANSKQGQMYIFKTDDNENWKETVKIEASDRSKNDLFGYSVSASGDRIIVGAPGCNSGIGRVYLITKNGADVWKQQTVLTSESAKKIKNHFFGCSVAIDGDYAIVGANSSGKDTGYVYVFKNTGTDNWKEIGRLKSGGNSDDNFGYCVSLYKNYLIVGAPTAYDGGKNRGRAYIFRNDGTDNWKQSTVLTASDKADDCYFGRSVSMYANYAIVGAPLSDAGGNDRGQAYIFTNDGKDHWKQTAILKASDQLNDNYFGHSVSAFGKYVVIGAPRFQSRGGKIFLFKNVGAQVWQETDICKPHAKADYRGFGLNVLLSDKFAFSSAIAEISSGTGRSQVYSYY
jgi:hypothetical protein